MIWRWLCERRPKPHCILNLLNLYYFLLLAGILVSWKYLSNPKVKNSAFWVFYFNFSPKKWISMLHLMIENCAVFMSCQEFTLLVLEKHLLRLITASSSRQLRIENPTLVKNVESQWKSERYSPIISWVIPALMINLNSLPSSVDC